MNDNAGIANPYFDGTTPQADPELPPTVPYADVAADIPPYSQPVPPSYQNETQQESQQESQEGSEQQYQDKISLLEQFKDLIDLDCCDGIIPCLYYAGPSFIFAVASLAICFSVNYEKLPVYGYTDYIPPWANIVIYVIHLIGLVVAPFLLNDDDIKQSSAFVIITRICFPLMGLFELLAVCTNIASPSIFHIFLALELIVAFAATFFVSYFGLERISYDLMFGFVLASILSIGSRGSSIMQEMFNHNPFAIPYLKYDSLFATIIAAGGILCCFSASIFGLIVYIIFWAALFLSYTYPTFGAHIVPIIFVILSIANICIRFFCLPSDSKALTAYKLEDRTIFLVGSALMTGLFVCMDIVNGIWTSPMGFFVFFGIAFAFIFYAYGALEDSNGFKYTGLSLLLIVILINCILGCLVYGWSYDAAGYIGSVFVDVTTQHLVFQFLVFYFGHLTMCPQAIYLTVLFLYNAIAYVLRYGFLMPGGDTYMESVIMIVFCVFWTVMEAFTVKAGKVFLTHPIALVCLMFCIIGLLEIIAIVLAIVLFVLALIAAAFICQCGLRTIDTIRPHDIGDTFTDCFGQMWEVVPAN